MSSKILDFGVPIDISRSNRHWVVGEHKFHLKDEKVLRILGSEIKVFTIESNIDSVNYHYLYSHDNGLLGFRVNSQRGVGTYFITQKKGYPKK